MTLHFQDLEVWKRSMLVLKQIYTCLKTFPKDEQYILTDQMRRSALSIVSNIAEGSGRGTNLDYAHFLDMARGSCNELYAQILVTKELNYISSEETEKFTGELEEIIKILFTIAKNKRLKK